MMRLAGKRLAGQTTTFDLLVLISLAVVLQQMALLKGTLNAAIFIATVFAAHLATARACRRSRRFKRLVRGSPRPLVVAGRVQHAALEEEGLTYEDLLAGFRKVGESDPGRIALATLEETGQITVVVATREAAKDVAEATSAKFKERCVDRIDTPAVAVTPLPMQARYQQRAGLATLLLLLAGCMRPSSLPPQAGFGPDPALPEPILALLPTVVIAPATGWPEGATPTASAGFAVQAFARGLDHPRWLHVLPNGDVLVAETNAPPRPEDGQGVKGWVMKQVMARAGAAVPSANRITLLRDTDGDGVADVRSVFVQGLNSPFGMALVGDQLYIANTDAIVRYPYVTGSDRIAAPPTQVSALPAGPRNHHWTKNILAGQPGTPGDGKLYVTVGSNSNAAENGQAAEENRAAILEIDLATGSWRVFASGLRNPNSLAWHPDSGDLWTVVNERDELGNDLVPDYLTSVRDGAFYGWPWSYYGPHVDARVQPVRADKVAAAIRPDFALGAHTGSLGLAFYAADLLPARYRGGAFVGQHGSWNRKPRSGYALIFVPFANGRPAGPAEQILDDFVDADGDALGRPVGVAIDSTGAVLLADDVGNTVWRVVPTRDFQTNNASVSDGVKAGAAAPY